MRRLLIAAALFIAGPALAQAAPVPVAVEAPAQTAVPAGMTPEQAAAHDALRGLRDRLVKGVNDKNPDAILADLDDDILFTAMNRMWFTARTRPAPITPGCWSADSGS